MASSNPPPQPNLPPEQDDLTPNTDNPLRRKALHRLIGAAVLVLIGVILLPWVFDAPPPELSPDINLRIEGKEDTATAATTPTTVVAQADATKTTAPEIAPKSEPKPTPKPKTETKPKVEEAPKPEPKPEPKVEQKPKPKPKPQKQPQTLDELIAQRTKKPAAKKPTVSQFPETGRFVVQVGAYTEAERVRKVRQTLTKAGLKSYIQNIEAKGKTITRVRLGPFTTRKQLQVAAAKARALGFTTKLYSL